MSSKEDSGARAEDPAAEADDDVIASDDAKESNDEGEAVANHPADDDDDDTSSLHSGDSLYTATRKRKHHQPPVAPPLLPHSSYRLDHLVSEHSRIATNARVVAATNRASAKRPRPHSPPTPHNDHVNSDDDAWGLDGDVAEEPTTPPPLPPSPLGGTLEDCFQSPKRQRRGDVVVPMSARFTDKEEEEDTTLPAQALVEKWPHGLQPTSYTTLRFKEADAFVRFKADVSDSADDAHAKTTTTATTTTASSSSISAAESSPVPTSPEKALPRLVSDRLLAAAGIKVRTNLVFDPRRSGGGVGTGATPVIPHGGHPPVPPA